MSYTTVGITTFVLGVEASGNRENRDFATGKAYDLDPTDSIAYTDDSTEFPVL
jgi:hypothetical protein